MSHKTVTVAGLDAEVDERVVPLVVALTRFPRLKTVASCQGEPGPMMEGGAYGYVDFVYGSSWLSCCRFCFGLLAPAFRDMYDNVMISVWQTDAAPCIYASLKIRTEAISEAAAAVEKLYAVVYRRSR